MALPIRPSTTKNTNHDTQYSLRVIRPEKEKGALNIENQGLTPKPAYYNPSHRIIRPRASFLIDNKRFLGDFFGMRKSLSILALLALGAVLPAADQGRELIRDIITEEGLSAAVILNARNPEPKAKIKSNMLAKAPQSARAIDNFAEGVDLLVVAEMVSEGHRVEITAAVGDINDRSRAFLLAQGVPAPLIEKTAAVLSVKVDGKELSGDALNDFAEGIANEPDDNDPRKLTAEEESFINMAFDKDVDTVLVVGRNSPEWRSQMEKGARDNPEIRNRIQAVAANMTHFVMVSAKKHGVDIALAIVIGDMKGKPRAALLASGTPEPMIDDKSAVISVVVNGEQLKGDKLDLFAEGFRKAHEKHAPPPPLKSLADLSK
jgi:hypothetical protein